MPIIDPETWRVLEPLLDRAFELEPAERCEWLDFLSSQSPELGAALRAILSEDTLADRKGFLSDVPRKAWAVESWKVSSYPCEGGGGGSSSMV